MIGRCDTSDTVSVASNLLVLGWMAILLFACKLFVVRSCNGTSVGAYKCRCSIAMKNVQHSHAVRCRSSVFRGRHSFPNTKVAPDL